MVYSFNASRLVTVWGGFSTKWYGELIANKRMLDAAWLSLRIAAVNVTISLANVAVVVHSRLSQLDGSMKEAALDLGARPWKVFVVITLPLIAAALLAGWLLAFTLSLDDLVIASFVFDPGASTLPLVVYSSVRLGAVPKSMRWPPC